MSWQMIALIAIGVTVLLSIPVIIMTVMVFKRAGKVIDTVATSMTEMTAPLAQKDPFGDLEKRVAKMTGPGPNPFEQLRQRQAATPNPSTTGLTGEQRYGCDID